MSAHALPMREILGSHDGAGAIAHPADAREVGQHVREPVAPKDLNRPRAACGNVSRPHDARLSSRLEARQSPDGGRRSVRRPIPAARTAPARRRCGLSEIGVRPSATSSASNRSNSAIHKLHLLDRLRQSPSIAPPGHWPLHITKKRQSVAAAGVLRRVVQREVALEAFAVGLDEVDAVLVRAPAVAALAVALDALDGPRGVRIAGVPDAGRGLIVPEQHLANVGEHVEAQPPELGLERGEVDEGGDLLVDGEPVLGADRRALDLEIVQTRARDAEHVQIAEPVAHARQLVGGGVVAVERDDQARREPFAHETFDRRVRLRRRSRASA